MKVLLLLIAAEGARGLLNAAEAGGTSRERLARLLRAHTDAVRALALATGWISEAPVRYPPSPRLPGSEQRPWHFCTLPKWV